MGRLQEIGVSPRAPPPPARSARPRVRRAAFDSNAGRGLGAAERMLPSLDQRCSRVLRKRRG